MRTIKEMSDEFIQFRRNEEQKRRNTVLTAKGLNHLGTITDEEYNATVAMAGSRYGNECKGKLYELANESNIPLALWVVDKLSIQQAFYVFKKLPMYVDELDALANATGWCDSKYFEYRQQAIDSGALFERPKDASA